MNIHNIMNHKHYPKAFTLVELLIVIVVIAILAAISIVAYNGIQERAQVASVSSALTQAIKKIKLWQVDNPDTAPASLSDADITTPPNVTFQYSRASNNQDYCITATQDKTSYYLNSITQTTPTSGGCPGHGVGGVQAVTNQFIDPDAKGSINNFSYSGGTLAQNTREIATDQFHNGTTSLKTKMTGTSGQIGTAAKVSSSFLVPANTKISWSFWIYSTKAGSMIAYADARKASDNTYTGCSGGSFSVPANTWTRVFATCTFPQPTYPTQAGAYNLSVSNGDIIWTDEFMLSVSDSPISYGDGNSSNWIWNGTPNSSTSTGPAQ